MGLRNLPTINEPMRTFHAIPQTKVPSSNPQKMTLNPDMISQILKLMWIQSVKVHTVRVRGTGLNMTYVPRGN